ncbi:MAG: 50S ribosomal protein L6 [Candidatus Melainabacteria bacterium RIFCSPLOWO2_02_FULL_35_15]|nr:MAG: 50S ribosomal protein L6 [Candidatus Melainabacteria bacterium RIFCSPLOWO2_12_FULL_35_11]OGI12862.1 MAG: 50S ribosomal protein L6 [Candidatus Melainabacteria bacterium RIFCSPLOWO2_02_FULL_35_15]
MSRIGKNPINIPDKVEITITDTLGGQIVRVKGPKGELESKFRKEIKITKEDKKIIFNRENDEKLVRSLHGLIRSLVQNMILGVTEGFKKELDIVGVGYKAQLQGTKLVLQMGYSHPVEVTPPNKETKIEVDKTQTHLTITGISKQTVGDLAAYIRSVRFPEPYKGKGIKYSDEKIRRKVGKSAAKK